MHNRFNVRFTFDVLLKDENRFNDDANIDAQLNEVVT